MIPASAGAGILLRGVKTYAVHTYDSDFSCQLSVSSSARENQATALVGHRLCSVYSELASFLLGFRPL